MKSKESSTGMELKLNRWLYLLGVVSLVLLSGCAGQNAPVITRPTPALSSTPRPAETQTGGDRGEPALTAIAGLVPTLAEVAPTRTLVPTATPDAVDKGVMEIVEGTGLEGKTLLWLQYSDWINLIISLFYVLIAYLIGTWLIRWLLPRLVHRTKTPLDDHLLEIAGDQFRWLAVVLILNIATSRLQFIKPEAKTSLLDVYFFLGLLIILIIVWRLINLAARRAINQAGKTGRREEAASLIMLTVWVLRFLLIILATTISLARFAVNITGIAIFLSVVGVALYLAGRDILADIVAGVIILIDRPYRVGDRIDLPGLDRWGDVVGIGMRSTRVLTLSNQLVVIPNSQIGKSQVVNYNYPDSSYYDVSKITVTYGNDPDQVVQVIKDTIGSVEGVQKKREIDALLMELTENQMIFWTGWWIDSYIDRFYIHDRVNRAVMRALKDANIELPHHKGSLKVEVREKGP